MKSQLPDNRPFLIGLIALRVGTFWALVLLLPDIRESENANSILDLRAGRGQRPSKREGLS